jgi:NAD+ synthase
MEYDKIVNNIIIWLKECLNDSGTKGFAVGISGGIDSAVVAALCKKTCPDNTLGIIMPCNSDSDDQEDAKLLAEALELEYKIVNLDNVFNVFLESLNEKNNDKCLYVANIKPRLRMSALYYFAQKNNYLVAGTGNKSEILTGYFTKYGDGGVDIEPIGHLFKTQVYSLAKYLNIPDKIINRKPTAGLWKNQSDEEEMGITYDELDNYLAHGKADANVKKIVDSLMLRSKHKRQLPPTPNL